jgi:hypothetical protein
VHWHGAFGRQRKRCHAEAPAGHVIVADLHDKFRTHGLPGRSVLAAGTARRIAGTSGEAIGGAPALHLDHVALESFTTPRLGSFCG